VVWPGAPVTRAAPCRRTGGIQVQFSGNVTGPYHCVAATVLCWALSPAGRFVQEGFTFKVSKLENHWPPAGRGLHVARDSAAGPGSSPQQPRQLQKSIDWTRQRPVRTCRQLAAGPGLDSRSGRGGVPARLSEPGGDVENDRQ
jgi:hypothetical protein